MTELERVADIVARDPELLLPTGQIIDLSDPNQVADALDQVRELKRRLDELRELLEDVLRLESVRQGTKTLHLQGFDAVVSGGSRVVYDGARLAAELERAGLPADRLERAVWPVVEWKTDGRVLKQLEAANPVYAVVIEAARSTVETPWRVTVKK